MNEYNDCLKALRELAAAIRSNGLSAADRNMMAGSLTIIVTKLERLAPSGQS
jgi:flagellin-like hook-associated protein FlgL